VTQELENVSFKTLSYRRSTTNWYFLYLRVRTGLQQACKRIFGVAVHASVLIDKGRIFQGFKVALAD